MALADTAPAARGDLRLTKPAELTLFALCVAQALFLAASFALGHWMIDADGRGVVADFVSVWAAGGLVLDGHPLAAYDWTIQIALRDGDGDLGKMRSALGLVRALGGGDTLAWALLTTLRRRSRV